MVLAIAAGSSHEEKRHVEREEQHGGRGGQEEWVLAPCEAHSPRWAGFQGTSVIPEQSKANFLLCDPTFIPSMEEPGTPSSICFLRLVL